MLCLCVCVCVCLLHGTRPATLSRHPSLLIVARESPRNVLRSGTLSAAVAYMEFYPVPLQVCVCSCVGPGEVASCMCAVTGSPLPLLPLV